MTYKDSNLERLYQKQLCYHYTIGHLKRYQKELPNIPSVPRISLHWYLVYYFLQLITFIPRKAMHHLQPNYQFRLMQYSTPADYEALRIRTCFLFNNKNSLTQISVMGLAVLYTKLTLAPIFTINTTADTVLTPCTY